MEAISSEDARLELRVMAREVVDGGETSVGPEEGLHARPAKEFLKKARQFASEIKVVKGKLEANAKSPIKLMTLGAKKDEKITIRAEGNGAEEAVDALVELVSKSEH